MRRESRRIEEESELSCSVSHFEIASLTGVDDGVSLSHVVGTSPSKRPGYFSPFSSHQARDKNNENSSIFEVASVRSADSFSTGGNSLQNFDLVTPTGPTRRKTNLLSAYYAQQVGHVLLKKSMDAQLSKAQKLEDAINADFPTESIQSFSSQLVASYCSNREVGFTLSPFTLKMHGCCFLADISGFTKMSSR